MAKIKNNKDLNNKLNKDLAYIYENGYSTSELTKLSGVQSGATYNRIKKVLGTMRTQEESKAMLKTHPDDFEQDVLDTVLEKGLYDYFIKIYDKKPLPKKTTKKVVIPNKLIEKPVDLEEPVEQKNSDDYATASELHNLLNDIVENYYHRFPVLEQQLITDELTVKIKDLRTGEMKKLSDGNYRDFQQEIKRLVLSKQKDAIVERNISFNAKFTEDEFTEIKSYIDNSRVNIEEMFPTIRLSTFFRKRDKVVKLRFLIYNNKFK